MRYRIPFVGRGAVCLILAICLLVPATAAGFPAWPEPTELEQPDGTRITVRLRGDEFFSWHESADGRVIMKDPRTDTWVYAKEQDERLVPTDLVVGRNDAASTGLAQPDLRRIRGGVLERSEHKPQDFDPDLLRVQATTMQNLVILVSFNDWAVDYTQPEYDDLFNQAGFSAGGASGSVRDYYDEISYGELQVVSTVVGPITISQGFAYYGANDVNGSDSNPRAMVTEALAGLEETGFDFSTMDGNGDGWVDGLTIIHAGRGEEFSGNNSDYIWSHKWTLSMPLVFDGVSLQSYHTEPAQHGWDSNPASWSLLHIGVVCHETGHFLGLPDLYDRDGGSHGAGNFCVMAGGGGNGDGHVPCHMSAWCKRQLGWLAPQWVHGDGTFSVLQAATNPSAVALNGVNINQEYYLVENRQAVGFDAALPGPLHGLLIWHVDPYIGNNDNPAHYMVDVEEASGVQHLELDLNAGEDDDYWRGGHVDAFTVASTPNNLKYDGDALSMEITGISPSSATMNFRVTTYHTWVDFNYGGSETGTYLQPYSTLLEGTTHVPVDGGLAVKNGVSYETINTFKNCVLYAPFGNALVGP